MHIQRDVMHLFLEKKKTHTHSKPCPYRLDTPHSKSNQHTRTFSIRKQKWTIKNTHTFYGVCQVEWWLVARSIILFNFNESHLVWAANREHPNKAISHKETELCRLETAFEFTVHHRTFVQCSVETCEGTDRETKPEEVEIKIKQINDIPSSCHM